MRPIISTEESAKLDAAAAEPVDVLMDRAGYGVALAAARIGAGYGVRVRVLTGKGNNGGDGYVAARYLAGRGASVSVHALGEPPADSAAGRAAAQLRIAGIPINPLADPLDADLVIDGLFGVGFRGTLPQIAVPWIDAAAPVLAIDFPSGLDADSGTADGPVFTAERTVTFHALKLGHVLGQGPERCGAVDVVDIGLEGGHAELLLCEADDAPRPSRDRAAHKWRAGSVLVVGGSPGISGAALLAAKSVLTAGAGAVTLVCPGPLEPVYAAMSPGVITRGVGSGATFMTADAGPVLGMAERFDVLVLGPGLGPVDPGFVLALINGWQGGLIVDADALNALQGIEALAARAGPAVITPHHGEFRRLTGRDAGYESAAALPDEAGLVVLLKGNPTFVLGAERWVVTSGGPELASIGTGDVLAGLLGALWARGLDPETAARSAAYWHGRAGRSLSARTTVTAEGLVDEIGKYAF